MELLFRPYQKSDRTAIAQIIREAWHYDELCSGVAAAKLADIYLSSCLINQTYTQVAVADGVPVGIIMGKNRKTHRCPLSLRWQFLTSLLSLCLCKEGRTVSKIFVDVEAIDKELLAQCTKDYPGELAFFAVSAACRGKGIGKALFEHLKAYMKSQNISSFYLFTDTSCNYPFYEHAGMKRRQEKAHTFITPTQKREMRFFLYDFGCDD